MHAVIIIPTYNERKNISPLIDEVLKDTKEIKNFRISILVVDDTSPDGTAEVIRKKQKKNKSIHLLVNPKKLGLGAAYLKGMDYAVNELKADVMIEMDADFSHDSKKLKELLAKIDEGYDMVLGSRYVRGGSIPEDWGLHRKFLSRVGNLFIQTLMFNFRVKDWTGGFRAIKKEVYKAVKDELVGERFHGYTFQIGFLHKAIGKGYKVAEVPFHFIDRKIGISKLGPDYLVNALMYVFKARLLEVMRSRFLKFAVVGGIGALVQLVSLQAYRGDFAFQLAFFLSIESAIVSNFILNNLWTYKDKRLKLFQIPVKFLQFNLASAGSIVIQQVIAFLGETFIGLRPLFDVPVINFNFDTGTLFAVIGILIGMFWNFFAYNKFIWKIKK
jgi:dolichol-phosphate mannosyltransferase